MAFRAIAADQRLLFTTAGATAQALADQAEKIARTLKEMSASSGVVLDSICDIVLQHIEDWRVADKKFSDPFTVTDPESTPAKATLLVKATVSSEVKALIDQPERRCPQFSNPAGKTITSIISEMGAVGLAGLNHSISNNMSVITARFVARCTRSKISKDALSREDCLKALQIIEDWAVTQQRPLLQVGYEGSLGTFAARARGLAYDAITCMSLSAGLPSGERGAGFCRWETAVEKHSYAAIALDPDILKCMPFDKAKLVAASAIRHVNAGMEQLSSGPILDVPEFFEVRPPEVIKSILMRLFTGGLPPRQSEIAKA